MLDAAVTTAMIEAVTDRAQLGQLLTRLRAGRPVRDLATAVAERVGERDAVSFSTISSWCRGASAPNHRQFTAFGALLAECEAGDADLWFDAVRRIRGADGAGPSPYPGLVPFAEADAAAFSGRDAVIDETMACVERVAASEQPDRVVAVIGASGSGKTSLIHAGLLPRLRAADREATVVEAGDQLDDLLTAVDATMAASSALVVDRLEQLLRSEVSHDVRSAFFAALTDARRQGVTILVLRADFYDRAAQHPVVLRALRTAQVLVGPMTEADLTAAIEGPARAAGSVVPEGLVELVKAEAGRAPGLLPHLSHALRQTWEHGRRGRMSIADYRAVGGVAGAIEQTAEAAYAELSPRARDAARRVFLRMVDVADDVPLTRRAVTRSELSTIIDPAVDEQDRRVLLEHLVAARLLVVDGEEVEVVHEVLLRAWPRLAGWVESVRESLRTQAGLRVATSLWLDGGRQDADLARGAALHGYRAVVADGVLATTVTERGFVEASERALLEAEVAQRRRVRRLRLLLAAASALALVAATLAVVAVVAGRDAAAARDGARQARDDALSRQVAVTAQGLVDSDPSVAALLAVSAYRVAPTLEARSAVLEIGHEPLPQRILGGAGSKAVALSADGGLLVTSDAVAGTVELLARDRSGSYRHAGTLELGEETYALALAPGGRVLAAGGTDTKVRLWDVSDPAAPRALGDPLVGVRGPVQRVAFSPDGSELAAVGQGEGVYRWGLADPAAPSRLPTFAVPSGVTWSVAYRPDGRALAVTDDEGEVHLIRHRDGRIVGTISPAGEQSARVASFSPDGSRLAVGSVVTNLFQVWDVRSLRAPRAVPDADDTFTSYVNDVRFSADGRYAAAASSDSTVKVWDTSTWTEVVVLHHAGLVTQLAFAEDGTLATAATDGTTRVWQLPRDLPLDAPASVFNVSQSARTGMVAAVGNGHLQLVRPDPDGRLTPAHARSLLAPSATGGGGISPDGRFVTQGHRDGRLQLHPVDPGPPRGVTVMDDPAFGAVRDVAWSPDGRLVAAVGDVELRVFDVSDPAHPRATARITQESQAVTLAWRPHDRLLAVTYGRGPVRLYDVTDAEDPVLAAELDSSSGDATALAFDPSGDLLAVGGASASVTLWKVADTTRPRRVGEPLRGPTSTIQWAAFSPDDTLLVATSNAGVAWIWDVGDPTRPTDFAVLGPVDGALFGVVFDRTGDRIAAGGTNNRLNVWPVDLDQVVAHVCADLGAGLTAEEWRTHVRGVSFVDPC
ncbi:nSTAND1 domain-containing NTPase [Nocardioides nitrophenolicus]|uniref:nSTAND1 domain-containing NTPase n=1 Tax=Nocardioides nitrophenolicus TaxID=60489 RepID=UPI00195E6B58|nr:hypothetical protein [Nocardioides nitrophenolicus]MBM7516706.1 WD40 repeat protein [Nocardioides nitrophenolicus]